MRRTVLQFLDDIVDSIDRIERYTKGVTFESAHPSRQSMKHRKRLYPTKTIPSQDGFF